MKKIFLVFVCLCLSATVFAQANLTVDVSDEVYEVLSNAEARGLCKILSTVRPYTEKYILSKLDEILESLDAEDDSFKASIEYKVIQRERERFVRNHEEGFHFDWRQLGFRVEKNYKIPVAFDISNYIVGFVSPAVYIGNDNSFGYEVFENLDIKGDIGNNVSFRALGYIGLTKMPLEFMGTYDIGYWWFEDKAYLFVPAPFDTTDPNLRRIKTYRNRSVIPYNFVKYWGGSVRHIGNINAAGLTDWCEVDSMAFGMFAEIHASFLDNMIEVSAARINREWAAMDNGASLVLNSKARPFFALESTVHLFPQVSFSALTGFLEFPNQAYINEDAWTSDKWTYAGDYVFFQNLFSIGQLDVDFKYFHFDFGSTVVYPKRFDLGYAFPLLDRVIYQDFLGDCDNLALFTDLKVRKPGVGSIWFSIFLDEMPSWNPKEVFNNMFVLDRYMFALQAGTKVVLPFLPFATISFRYTKVEPYCYTHNAINYVPWYFGRYISESYTNNGESLGYYLPPNSDEFHIRIETRPSVFSTVGLQYQLVRHGADFGSRQVDGSSLYSELSFMGRSAMKKNFLYDGAYEWSNIITIQGSYDFKQFKVPVVLNCTFGIVSSYFTDAFMGDGITRAPLGDKGINYSKIETDEYKSTTGFIFTIGFTLFGR